MKKIILWLFYAYLILFPLGQLIRIPPQSTKLVEIHFFLTDVVVASIVVLWLGWKWFKKSKFLVPPLSKPILLFVVCCLLSLLVNTSLLFGREAGVASLYLVRWVVYAGLYFVVYDLAKEIRNLKLEIRNLLIGTGLGTALLGLAQYIFIPDTRFLEKYGWDPHLYRVIGTFFDPGFLGAILVLTLILIVILGWNQENRLLIAKQQTLFIAKQQTLFIFAGIIVYLALALTYSRASYLAYLTGMGTIAWLKKSPKFFLTVFLVGAVTVFLLPRPEGEGVRLERESTIKYRIINWKQSLTIAQNQPVFGVGFNAYRYAQRRYGFLDIPEWQLSHAGAGADSSLLFILATTGIVGFSSYLWLWWKILKTGDLIILASAFALLVHSTFVNSLLYPWIMAWMWILLGQSDWKE